MLARATTRITCGSWGASIVYREQRRWLCQGISPFDSASEAIFDDDDAVEITRTLWQLTESRLREIIQREKNRSSSPDEVLTVVIDCWAASESQIGVLAAILASEAPSNTSSLCIVSERWTEALGALAYSQRAAVVVAAPAAVARALGWLREASAVQRAVERMGARYQWSPQQRAIVRLRAEGVPLKCVGERLGVSHETVRTQLSRLRQKCEHKDTESLVLEVLHDAIKRR